MEQLKNDNFLVEIDRHGAAINHIYNLQEHFDYMWNNDVWSKHAPVLFPAIGRSNNDAYLYKDKKYEMPQHGFVSEYDFDVIKKNETELSLQLSDNKKTFALYPFHFTLNINFSLGKDGLKLSFNIKNDDTKSLSFSLGSHPAFNLPINGEGKFEDYRLQFSPEPQELKQFEIVKKPNPYRSGNIKKIAEFNGELPLNYHMFDDGLIIIENDGINKVKVLSSKTKHSIELDLHDFRYLTLWTKEGANASFLCLEPFNGLPDVYGDLKDIMHKEGNTVLQEAKSKSYSYKISLS